MQKEKKILRIGQRTPVRGPHYAVALLVLLHSRADAKVAQFDGALLRDEDV